MTQKIPFHTKIFRYFAIWLWKFVPTEIFFSFILCSLKIDRLNSFVLKTSVRLKGRDIPYDEKKKIVWENILISGLRGLKFFRWDVVSLWIMWYGFVKKNCLFYFQKITFSQIVRQFLQIVRQFVQIMRKFLKIIRKS